MPETMNLDAYFDRIGYRGPRAPTQAVLQAICAAQPAAIVYENLDPFLGCVPRLGLQALQEKLVERRRGGYCFELNLLLRTVLLSLGMRVTCLAARVVWNSPPGATLRPRTHMLLKVEVSDAWEHALLVDLGFGGQLFGTPLLLSPGLVQATPLGAYRVTSDGKIHTVEAELAQGWTPLYQFSLEPQLPVDYEPANWFTATHPTSVFRHNVLMQALTPQGRAGLFNDRLVLHRPGAQPEMRRIGDAGEFAQVLEQVFHLAPPVPAHEIFARMPKGLDHFVIPDAANA